MEMLKLFREACVPCPLVLQAKVANIFGISGLSEVRALPLGIAGKMLWLLLIAFFILFSHPSSRGCSRVYIWFKNWGG